MILIISLLSLFISTMKIHPFSTKRNTTFLENRNDRNAPHKLRRLPHVFAKVLELPFSSDADVTVEDTPNSVKFVAGVENSGVSGDSIRAHMVEIYPGITKVVIRDGEVGDLLGEKIRVGVWRCRLPAVARPELTTAVVVDGEIVVTVPKSGDFRVLRNGDSEGFYTVKI